MTPDSRAAEDYYNRLRGLMPLEQFAQVQQDCGAMLAAIAALQDAMALTATAAQITSLQGQINAIAGALLLRPTVYLGITQKSDAKLYAKSVATVGAGGVATFNLTSDGLVAGGGNSAFFSNVYDETIDFEVNDSSNGYRFSWALSPDKKTLTVTVTRQAPVTILGIPVLGGLNPTPAGTIVRVTLWGD